MKTKAWIKVAVIVVAIGLLAYQWRGNAAQKNILMEVRDELLKGQEQFERQRSIMDKLQEEKEAAHAEANRVKQEYAKLLERKQTDTAALATLKSDVAVLKADDSNPLQKLLDNPEMLTLIREQSLLGVRSRYDEWMKQMKLTPEQQEKFVQLLGSGQQRAIDRSLMAQRGEIEKSDVHKGSSEAIKETEKQLKELLGEEGYASYKQYNRELPAKHTLDNLNSELGENPLTAEQHNRLKDVLLNTHSKPMSKEEIQLIKTAEGLDLQFARREEHNKEILEKAAEFLTEEQLVAFRTMQTNSLSLEKRMMKLGREMMSKGKLE